MGLRLASLNGDDRGVIFYDSVTMYAYAPIFRTEDEAYAFLDWFERTKNQPFNGYDGSHYAAMEEWIDETKSNKCADCDAPSVRPSAPEYSAGVDTTVKPRCERHARPVVRHG